jgi:hypothetical protein
VVLVVNRLLLLLLLGAGAAARGCVGVEWRLVRVGDGDVSSPQHLPVPRFECSSSVLQKTTHFQTSTIQESIGYCGNHAHDKVLIGSGRKGGLEDGDGESPRYSTHSSILTFPSFSLSPFFFPFRGMVEMMHEFHLPLLLHTRQRRTRGAFRVADPTCERESRVGRGYQTWRRFV